MPSVEMPHEFTYLFSISSANRFFVLYIKCVCGGVMLFALSFIHNVGYEEATRPGINIALAINGRSCTILFCEIKQKLCTDGSPSFIFVIDTFSEAHQYMSGVAVSAMLTRKDTLDLLRGRAFSSRPPHTEPNTCASSCFIFTGPNVGR